MLRDYRAQTSCSGHHFVKFVSMSSAFFGNKQRYKIGGWINIQWCDTQNETQRAHCERRSLVKVQAADCGYGTLGPTQQCIRISSRNAQKIKSLIGFFSAWIIHGKSKTNATPVRPFSYCVGARWRAQISNSCANLSGGLPIFAYMYHPLSQYAEYGFLLPFTQPKWKSEQFSKYSPRARMNVPEKKLQSARNSGSVCRYLAGHKFQSTIHGSRETKRLPQSTLFVSMKTWRQVKKFEINKNDREIRFIDMLIWYIGRIVMQQFRVRARVHSRDRQKQTYVECGAEGRVRILILNLNELWQGHSWRLWPYPG